MKLSIHINGKKEELVVNDEHTPLLWVLRDLASLKGTKFGCGKAACGACTVMIDGVAVRSCTYPISMVAEQQVTTIEGIGTKANPHPVQQAWIEEIVPQCGYCQPGFMMATVALIQQTPTPTEEQINNAISNICRCGTYFRIKKAIHRAIELNRLKMEQQNNPT